MKKRCCFAGHSDYHYTDELYHQLILLIEKLITQENVLEFLIGNYGAFDRLCAQAVRSLKNRYPDIQSNLVIPYLTADITNNQEWYADRFDRILLADLPENTPKKLQILKCNEYLVNRSDVIICYTVYSWGGAAKTVEYAKKKQLPIWNLADV